VNYDISIQLVKAIVKAIAGGGDLDAPDHSGYYEQRLGGSLALPAEAGLQHSIRFLQRLNFRPRAIIIKIALRGFPKSQAVQVCGRECVFEDFPENLEDVF